MRQESVRNVCNPVIDVNFRDAGQGLQPGTYGLWIPNLNFVKDKH